MSDEQIQIDHNVTVEVLDASGRVIETREARNLVTDAYLNQVRNALASFNSIVAAPYTLRIGTGSTPPTAADTALETQVASRVLDRRSTADKQVTFEVLYDTTEANGNTISEEGIFTVNGTLAARALIQPPVVKTASVQLTIKHVINLSRPT